jgi:tetratricopeptide (TPR) repeat protein
MFGFFSPKKSECPVNEETREWIERCILWLANSFGKENIKNRKVLVPNYDNFPIKYNGQPNTVLETMKIVARQMEISPEEIHIDIYKEGQREIDTGSVMGNRMFLQNKEGEKYSGGLYFGKQDDGKYHIAIEERKLKDPLQIVATLSHELSHIKLLGEKKIEKNNEDLTDLTTVIFGLGIFNANVAFQTKNGYDSWSWSKSGYLSQMEWAYALALFAHIKEEENPNWISFLSRNIKSDFIKSTNFIRSNPDKIFKSKSKSRENNQQNEIENKINKSSANRNFEEVIIAYKKLLESNPNSKGTYNNIGYAMIQQKKYSEAIEYFDKAIELDKRWDFPFNNRGYCKLQLGDLKNAFIDINNACEMNPFNSYAWRNLGAYYLKTNEFKMALNNFKEAEKIDQNTELINFYLAKTYEKLGNAEKAKLHLDKSAELKEYTDSLTG